MTSFVTRLHIVTPATWLNAKNSPELKLDTEQLELIESGNNYDLNIIKPDEGKDYTVEQMNSLLKWSTLAPYSESHKMAVIEFAEMLTVECQNKLLKLLEEPPIRTSLILVANGIHQLLPTILSRCVISRSTGAKSKPNTDIVELATTFFTTTNLVERMALIAEIQTRHDRIKRAAIVEEVFDQLFAQLINENKLDLIEKYLDLYVMSDKNQYNQRLTLETLAIMLNK